VAAGAAALAAGNDNICSGLMRRMPRVLLALSHYFRRICERTPGVRSGYLCRTDIWRCCLLCLWLRGEDACGAGSSGARQRRHAGGVGVGREGDRSSCMWCRLGGSLLFRTRHRSLLVWDRLGHGRRVWRQTLRQLPFCCSLPAYLLRLSSASRGIALHAATRLYLTFMPSSAGQHPSCLAAQTSRRGKRLGGAGATVWRTQRHGKRAASSSAPAFRRRQSAAFEKAG
jgi:hypothetical protein